MTRARLAADVMGVRLVPLEELGLRTFLHVLLSAHRGDVRRMLGMRAFVIYMLGKRAFIKWCRASHFWMLGTAASSGCAADAWQMRQWINREVMKPWPPHVRNRGRWRVQGAVQ